MEENVCWVLAPDKWNWLLAGFGDPGEIFQKKVNLNDLRGKEWSIQLPPRRRSWFLLWQHFRKTKIVSLRALLPYSSSASSREVWVPSWATEKMYGCLLSPSHLGRAPLRAQLVKNLPAIQGDPGSIPGSGRSTGEEIGYSLQYSWASLVAQLVKNLPAVWETWVQSLGWEDPLEKGKAIHSGILACRIPWTV